MLMGTNAVESPSNNRSPRSGDGPNSLQSRQTGSTTARNLSSPWANVVRGGGGGGGVSVEGESAASTAAAFALPLASLPSVVVEFPPLEPAAQESDCSPGKALPTGNVVAENASESREATCNAAKASKKPAWNKPLNSFVEAGAVMGAAWPALSESARVSAKSSDGSTPAAVSTGPSTPLHKTTNNNSTPNHVFPARHKPSSSGGRSMGPNNNGGFVAPPAEMSLSVPGAPVTAAVEVPPDSSPRDPPHKNGNWKSGSRAPFIQQSHIGADPPRGAFRRGNGNSRDGYRNRRDHERKNYEWHQPQGFNDRDVVHVRQSRILPRNIFRPLAPTPGPFVAPHIRPYGGPMGFSDLPVPKYYVPVPPPESVRGGLFVSHPGPPPSVFYTPPAPHLQTMLIEQIDYYFR